MSEEAMSWFGGSVWSQTLEFCRRAGSGSDVSFTNVVRIEFCCGDPPGRYRLAHCTAHDHVPTFSDVQLWRPGG